MVNFIHAARKYYKFTASEVFQVVITALIAGFVLSYDNWGHGNEVDVSMGLIYLAWGFIFILFSLILHVVAQKLTAIKLGNVVTYSYWKLGLLIGVMLTFITDGFIPVFFTGALSLQIVDRLRVGKYGPRFRHWEYGLSSIAGPLVNLTLVLVAQYIYLATQSPLVLYFIRANLFMLFWSLVPIPFFHGIKVIQGGRTAYDWKGGTVGFNLFVSHRGLYGFFLITIMVYMLLSLMLSIFSFFLSLLVALIIWVVFYVRLSG